MENTINLVNWSGSVEIIPLSISLSIGLVLGLILRYHFNKFASVVGNKDHISKIFPYIVVTTIFIITIVKSSLALSLGLVGALSIVRFRTPIKEPEELAYLFICIGIGLGLGANHIVPTIVSSFFLLIIISTSNIFWKKRCKYNKSTYLFLTFREKVDLNNLNKILLNLTLSCDLRRFDSDNTDVVIANYIINISDVSCINDIENAIRIKYPSLSVSFIDHRDSPKI